MKIRLTKAQRSAVEIYVVDPAHECSIFTLEGSVLHVHADVDTACTELIDASNSADADGAGGTALVNLARAVRKAWAIVHPFNS